MGFFFTKGMLRFKRIAHIIGGVLHWDLKGLF